ncbi:MAG: serine hydrolase [Flavobacteriales bacterium]
MVKILTKYLLIIGLFFSINTNAQNLYFPPLTGNTWETTDPASLGWCQRKIDSLYDFLNVNGTKAFMVLKDGKIVLEQYFNDHNMSSNWYWASAGKTLTAFMTGMAQQEGFLNIQNPTSTYLGQGWTVAPEDKEALITVWHQLTMTTGLQDSGVDLDCTIDTCLKYLADAGTRWSYHNAPYTLLDQVIANATGMTLNNFTHTRLRQPIGMGGLFINVGFNNVFFSNARSMARFGLLMLNNGNWNGNQIMTDQQYFQNMITRSQSLNNSYGYLWWLNGYENYMVPGSQFVIPGQLFPNAPADMYSALGRDGQILSVVPSQNLIIIRMGESPTTVPVPYLLNTQIWAYINDLICDDPLAINEINKFNFRVFPNPATDEIQFISTEDITQIIIQDITGKVLVSSMPKAPINRIDTSKLSDGVYIIQAKNAKSNTISQRLIISR